MLYNAKANINVLFDQLYSNVQFRFKAITRLRHHRRSITIWLICVPSFKRVRRKTLDSLLPLATSFRVSTTPPDCLPTYKLKEVKKQPDREKKKKKGGKTRIVLLLCDHSYSASPPRYKFGWKYAYALRIRQQEQHASKNKKKKENNFCGPTRISDLPLILNDFCFIFPFFSFTNRTATFVSLGWYSQ